jgi:hypothetical protein
MGAALLIAAVIVLVRAHRHVAALIARRDALEASRRR